MVRMYDKIHKSRELVDRILLSMMGDEPIHELEMKVNGSKISLQDFLMEDTSIVGEQLQQFAADTFYADWNASIYSIIESNNHMSQHSLKISPEECATAIRRFCRYTWDHTPSVRDAYVSAYKHARNMVRGTIQLSEGLALSSSLSKLVRDANVKAAHPISAMVLKEMVPGIRELETDYARLIPKSRLSPVLDLVVPKRVERRKQNMHDVASYLKERAERVIPRLNSFGHEYRNWYLTQHDHVNCLIGSSFTTGGCPKDRQIYDHR
ncbi:MAG: hypothetical protein V1729_06570 [Candidatus Woesearchaeota archaeon]